jgi:hypothetical protein
VSDHVTPPSVVTKITPGPSSDAVAQQSLADAQETSPITFNPLGNVPSVQVDPSSLE